jgi:general secretion pathway protein K
MTRSRRAMKDRGFAVVTVLWMLALLAALATASATYVSSSALNLRIIDEEVQIDALIEAALELTMYQRSVDRSMATSGTFAFTLAGARVGVEFVPESARIDLNSAPRAMLAGLFASFGVGADNANYYADRVMGWRSSPAKTEKSEQEEELYRAAGLAYQPRKGPFAHVDELWLVAGLPHWLVERAMPFVTVYSGRPDVNAFHAPPQVIAAVPGIPRERIDAFLKLRQTPQPDWQSALAILGAGQSSITTAVSDAIRVLVRIDFASGRHAAAEVTILPSEKGGYRTLAWLDGREAPSPEVQTTGTTTR